MGTSFLHKQSQSQVKKKLNMKTLLVIALFAVVHAEEMEKAADPVAPVVYTHPFYHHMAAPVYAHHAPVYTHHVAAPVVYTAANVCKNEGGQLVPCAHGVAPGSAIYAHVGAPAGVVPVAAPAAETAAEDVVSVEKRDAEAEGSGDAEAEADPQLVLWILWTSLWLWICRILRILWTSLLRIRWSWMQKHLRSFGSLRWQIRCIPH